MAVNEVSQQKLQTPVEAVPHGEQQHRVAPRRDSGPKEAEWNKHVEEWRKPPQNGPKKLRNENEAPAPGQERWVNRVEPTGEWSESLDLIPDNQLNPVIPHGGPAPQDLEKPGYYSGPYLLNGESGRQPPVAPIGEWSESLDLIPDNQLNPVMPYDDSAPQDLEKPGYYFALYPPNGESGLQPPIAPTGEWSESLDLIPANQLNPILPDEYQGRNWTTPIETPGEDLPFPIRPVPHTEWRRYVPFDVLTPREEGWFNPFKLAGPPELQPAPIPPLTPPTDPQVPFADDYSRYFQNENLPGRDGSVNDLAVEKLMELYKDAPEGSNERRYYDLLLADSLIKNGYRNDSEFGAPIEGSEFGQYVLDPDAIKKGMEELLANTDFTNKMRENLRGITNQIIQDHFVMVDGKITLKDRNLLAHRNAPPVDLDTFARAGLNYATSEAGRNEFAALSPEGQQQFIREHFAFASFLPSADVEKAFTELMVGNSVIPVLNVNFGEISDEDLALALQTAGKWFLTARGPINFTGNLLNMKYEQWLELARAMKLTHAQGGLPTSWADVYNRLPEPVRGAFEFFRSGAGMGAFGALAGTAGIVGAIIHYTANSEARARLLNGDPREIMALSNNLALVLSYSTSMLKGPANLFAALGIPGGQWLVDQLNALPGFGKLTGAFLSEEFQPTFQQIVDALQLNDVDLTDQRAVRNALGNLAPDVIVRFTTDIGYDLDGLAKLIAQRAGGAGAAAEFGVAGFNSAGMTDVQLFGLLYDVTNVDPAYKDFAAAESIVAKHVGDIATDDDLRRVLIAGGMTPEAADRVVGEVRLAWEGVTAPDVQNFDDIPEINPRLRLAGRLNIAADPPPPNAQLADLVLEQWTTLHPSNLNLHAPQLTPRNVPGLLLKGLGAGMDVLGGLLGVGLGIYDIVAGANGNSPLKIAAGSLGIAGGVLGFFGGLAGLGVLAPAIATPLFVAAGVLGVFAMVVSFLSDLRPSREKFADEILGRFKNDNIIRPGGEKWLEDCHDPHLKPRENPAPPLSR